MSNPRFFLATGLEPVVGQELVVPLDSADAHHLVSVLRVRTGELVDVALPSGEVWCMRVSDANEQLVRAIAVERLPQVAEPSLTLFQGVAKGEKMDTIVRQAIEAGASGIVPVLTSRCVVRLDDRKRTERGQRWRRLAQSAAKQARRNAVPRIEDPVDFAPALDMLADYDHAIVLWEECGYGHLLSAIQEGLESGSSPRVALFVGPEGGLSADEVECLQQRGARVASLGASILRTETAAVVAVGVAIAALTVAGDSR